MELTKVLLCEPDVKWQTKLMDKFAQGDVQAEATDNGRDAQGILYKNKFDVIVIDLELKNHTALEVIKYVKFSNIKSKVILTIRDEMQMREYFPSLESLSKLGICHYFVKPYSFEALNKSILGLFEHQAWKRIKKPETITDEKEITARDDSFTSIKIEEFFCGNASIFDLYIRLKPNKYLKILHAGDFFNPERIEEYRTEKNVEFFYFKTSDRLIYINYMNELVKKLASSESISPEVKVNFTKNLSEKYIDELYLKGLTSQNIKEGHKVCSNIYETVSNIDKLNKLLKDYCDFDDSTTSHLFLCSLYTTVVCKHIGWVTEHSLRMILFGAFLHDIGKIKLPKNIRDKKTYELSDKQLIEYQKHPQFGAELLEGVEGVNAQIVQVVYQHHELMDGSGFPNNLPRNKIYPLARIVSFTNRMSNKTIDMKCTPYEAIKHMIEQRTEIFKYDSDVVKAFLKGFVS